MNENPLFVPEYQKWNINTIQKLYENIGSPVDTASGIAFLGATGFNMPGAKTDAPGLIGCA